jgi:AcrR family transcriptional regulator
MSREYKKRKRAESEAETRLRITEATMALHERVGPARTTVSGIAQEAGVQRATVYRHFPDEEALVDACSTHWFSLHPPPDPTPWPEIEDPDERLRTALRAFYAYYDGTYDMLEKLVRDAPGVPPVAERMQLWDQVYAQLAEMMLVGRNLRGKRRERALAGIIHALQLQTWSSLVRDQGLSLDDAVELIAKLAD